MDLSNVVIVARVLPLILGAGEVIAIVAGSILLLIALLKLKKFIRSLF